jgi:hypothetical protein
MIVGDPKVFAIESFIATAYEELGLRALGFFLIHAHGVRYGVSNARATMLACSLDKVKQRVLWAGRHTIPFGGAAEAGAIAFAYRTAFFSPEADDRMYLGMPAAVFRREVLRSRIVWAPDGDAAFDDGSYVLQFDVQERVRLVGFRADGCGFGVAEGSLTDLWMDASQFYGVLANWSAAFESEWFLATKETGSERV